MVGHPEPIAGYLVRMINNAVISVPHSGSRSLKDHLNLKHMWHFNHHWDTVQTFFEEGIGHAHVPLRDFEDLYASWRRRYGTTKGLPETLDRMYECFDKYPDRITTYNIEDIPVHIGHHA